MIARLVMAFLLWCFAACAFAQVPMTGAGNGTPSSGGGGYTGPNDVVSGATNFWGLEAPDAAHATGSVSAADLHCGSSTFTALKILTSGFFDVATAISDCGSSSYSAGASVTIAATALTVTVNPTSGNFAAGQTLICNDTPTNCAGFPDGLKLSSGSGSVWVVSASATISTAVHVNTSLINVIKLYDMLGSCALVPQFTNQGPLLVPLYAKSGTLPGLIFSVSENLGLECTTGAPAAATGTFVAVAERFAVASTTLGGILNSNTAGVVMEYNNAANSMYCDAGSFGGNNTASDGARHLLMCVFNGAASIGAVDTTQNTGQSVGAGALATNFGFGYPATSGAGNVIGDIEFGGVWPILSTANLTSIHGNVSPAWGTP